MSYMAGFRSFAPCVGKDSSPLAFSVHKVLVFRRTGLLGVCVSLAVRRWVGPLYYEWIFDIAVGTGGDVLQHRKDGEEDMVCTSSTRTEGCRSFMWWQILARTADRGRAPGHEERVRLCFHF